MARRRRSKAPGQQTVVPSATRTTNGNSGTLSGWHAGAISSYTAPQSRLTITGGSGTSLTVTIEDSPDGTTWTTRDTYPAQTGTATVTRALPTTLVAYQRVSWAIVAGSFTFSVQFAPSTATLT
jgi:hypothetical protein